MEMKELKLGMVGLDTSHVVAFIDCFNQPSDPFYVAGTPVAAAFPGGSAGFSLSRERVEMFTEKVRRSGVRIVDSIADLAGLDGFLLTSVDGAQHLEQFRQLVEFGKPVYIDKPLACSYDDARAIFQLAAEKQIPIMTSSSLRFAAGICDALPEGEHVFSVEAFGPMALPEDYRDYFWYGIHTAEMVYTFLGRGCRTVRTLHTEKLDLITGVWGDGRIGSIAGNRVGAQNFGVRLTTDKAHRVSLQNPEIPYLASLACALQTFFRSGRSAIDPAESLEIIAFLEAASRSLAAGGAAVDLAEL